MIKETDFFEVPGDNIKVWKYFDFYKFFHMLFTKQLFFSRCDILFDKYEGKYSKRDIELLLEMDPKNEINYMIENSKNLQKANSIFRNHTFINCWHINNDESYAFWEIYSNKNMGIAIESSYDLLKHSFRFVNEDIIPGKVQYIDSEKESTNMQLIYGSFFYKRNVFSFENELRLLIVKYPKTIKKDENNYIDYNDVIKEKGIYFNVELESLIEKIYVNPFCADWEYETIKDLIKKYIDKPVLKSGI